MTRIGVLTIGQTPRPDLLPCFLKVLGDDVEIVEAGALNGRTLEDIEKVVLNPDDYILVTRLRDGTEVKITKKFIVMEMQTKLDELEDTGIRLTVIICTGEFPAFRSRGLVFTPQEMIKGVLKSSLKTGKLCVVYPAEEQVFMAANEYGHEGIDVVGDWVSPYEGDDELCALSSRLAAQDFDLILLNCFGYSNKVKDTIQAKTSTPIIQSNTLIARVVKELL